jgi:hypothetical protein
MNLLLSVNALIDIYVEIKKRSSQRHSVDFEKIDISRFGSYVMIARI